MPIIGADRLHRGRPRLAARVLLPHRPRRHRRQRRHGPRARPVHRLRAAHGQPVPRGAARPRARDRPAAEITREDDPRVGGAHGRLGRSHRGLLRPHRRDLARRPARVRGADPQGDRRGRRPVVLIADARRPDPGPRPVRRSARAGCCAAAPSRLPRTGSSPAWPHGCTAIPLPVIIAVLAVLGRPRRSRPSTCGSPPPVRELLPVSAPQRPVLRRRWQRTTRSWPGRTCRSSPRRPSRRPRRMPRTLPARRRAAPASGRVERVTDDLEPRADRRPRRRRSDDGARDAVTALRADRPDFPT